MMLAFFLPIYNSSRLEAIDLPSQKTHYCPNCNEARYFTFRLYRSVEKTFGLIPSGTVSVVVGKCQVCQMEFECDKETSRIIKEEIEYMLKEQKKLKKYKIEHRGDNGLEKV